MWLWFWGNAAIPFVEAIDWDQEAAVFIGRAKRRLFRDSLGSSVKGFGGNAHVFGPRGDQSPAISLEDPRALEVAYPIESPSWANIPTGVTLRVDPVTEGRIKE